MRLIIDTETRQLIREEGECAESFELYSKEAFELISHEWLKLCWNQKYTYTFSWLGRPIIQLPEDMIRLQEVIYRLQPDVIIETGIAHGGSLVYSASICRAIGKGRVIGVDIEIRPHNRQAIEAHELFPYITLIEGDSVARETVAQVQSLIQAEERVLVILDSCHTKAHVLLELKAYHGLVTPGSYIVATDGFMRDLYDVPRGNPEWRADNPTAAATDFLAQHPEFTLEQPAWTFNESELKTNLTHWPMAWLRKVGC